MTTETEERPARRRAAEHAAASKAKGATTGSRRQRLAKEKAAPAKAAPTKKVDLKKEATAKAKAKEAEKKAAAKAKADEKKAAEKAKVEAAQEAGNKTLAPIAKEINVRVEKAEKLTEDADDMRIAAALRLVDAEKVAEKAGIKFLDWCKINIHWAPETIRKMLPIGKASDPAKALADMRAGNKVANKKLRDKKKAAAAKVSRDTGEGDEGTDEDVAVAATEMSLADAKAVFDALRPADKMKLARYVASAIGATLTLPEFEEAA